MSSTSSWRPRCSRWRASAQAPGHWTTRSGSTSAEPPGRSARWWSAWSAASAAFSPAAPCPAASHIPFRRGLRSNGSNVGGAPDRPAGGAVGWLPCLDKERSMLGKPSKKLKKELQESGTRANATIIEIAEKGMAVTRGAEGVVANTEIALKTHLRVQPENEPEFEVKKRF